MDLTNNLGEDSAWKWQCAKSNPDAYGFLKTNLSNYDYRYIYIYDNKMFITRKKDDFITTVVTLSGCSVSGSIHRLENGEFSPCTELKVVKYHCAGKDYYNQEIIIINDHRGQRDEFVDIITSASGKGEIPVIVSQKPSYSAPVKTTCFSCSGSGKKACNCTYTSPLKMYYGGCSYCKWGYCKCTSCDGTGFQ